jgi:hypothetical protein
MTIDYRVDVVGRLGVKLGQNVQCSGSGSLSSRWRRDCIRDGGEMTVRRLNERF